MDQVKDKEQRNWYITESVQNGWSKPVIVHQIASKLYERQALLENKTTNFDKTLPFPNNDQVKELDIEKQLIVNITKLLLELGSGFASVGRQYHLEYVVIELKTTEFKPEYAGKLNFYLSAVDRYIKGENDNPTFGMLLCKNKKKITAELALKDINKPIGISEYKILSGIPAFLEDTFPSIEDIEKRLGHDTE